MVYKHPSTFTLSESKLAVERIIGVINTFLLDIEKNIPHQGYGVLAQHLTDLNDNIQKSNGKFLPTATANKIIDELIITFTTMHPSLEPHLKSFFDAQIEIMNFLEKYSVPMDYKLLDFDDVAIKKMVDGTSYANMIFVANKQKNFSDMVALHALFFIHSSKIATTEEPMMEELANYKNIINKYANDKQIKYSISFDPVKIFGIGNLISRKNTGKFYTEAKAMRHLLDHHHFTLENNSGVEYIHFQSPNSANWQFNYDRKMKCEEFYNFVILVDLFYKTIVNLLFTLQLTAVLRACFVL
ncbi:MAG: hypothetical protein ACREBB_05600 [Nitrosotalea sp.]